MQHSFWNKGFFAAAIVAVVAMAAPAAAADWKETAIAEVKASYWEGHEEEWPVGRSLELKFEDRGWMASETAEGTRLVEFQGTITPETNLRALQWWYAVTSYRDTIYTMGLAKEKLGEEKVSSLMDRGLQRGMSVETTTAVIWGVAFPEYWTPGEKAGILWRQMEDGFWLLETMASGAWGGLNHDQIVAAILY